MLKAQSAKPSVFLLILTFVILPFFQNCSGFTGEQLASSSFTVEDSSPENQEVDEGDLVRLFVVVNTDGSPVTYVWRKEGQNTDLGSSSEYSFMANTEDSGTYFLIISNEINQITMEFNVNVLDVTQSVAPAIGSKSVTSYSVTSGGTWNLNLSVTGTPTPSVQWYKGTPPNGTALTSKTSTTLNLTNLSEANEGSYYLIATNSAGNATSQVFNLQVQPQVQSYQGTHLYLGGEERVRQLFFNPSTQTIVDNGEVSFVGGVIAALTHYGPKFFAADVDGGNIQAYTIGNNYSLTSVTDKPFLPKSVFITVAEGFGKFLFFGASYLDSKVAYYQADNLNLQGFTEKTTSTYPQDSFSHSTSYSSSLNLLFAANLGQNSVRILNVTANATSAAGQISVASPRNVHYDPTYGKLYVITEGRGANSQLKVYTISKPTSTSATATEVGSYSFDQRGADLKISHQKNLLFTAARETGKEALHIIPLTASGLRDSSRSVYKITSIAQEPRSVSISNNGEYIFLTPNKSGSAPDLIVYKLIFNGNQQITSNSKVTQLNAGSEGFRSNYSIDIP